MYKEIHNERTGQIMFQSYGSKQVNKICFREWNERQF